MLSATAALLLACMPYRPPPPPPPVTVACEGADRVARNHDGLEVSRVRNACTVVRCEGGDRVRRTVDGRQLWREVNGCAITRCEGTVLVTRGADGLVLDARPATRCGPPPEPVVLRQTPDPTRFGLSFR